MEQFPDLKTKARNTVSEPKEMEKFKGLAWIAAGVVGISFIATSATAMWKMIFTVLGIVFIGIGGKWIRKYVFEYKAFQQFVPTWDSDLGMYDKFAQEFNAWHQDGIVPTCCDGDTLYFLKLQKERLEEKGIKMTNQVMPVKGSDYGTATISRKTPWYTTDMVYEEINRTLRFHNKQGLIYEREVEQVMYEIIVHTPNDAQVSHITMTCPNCGAVSPVTALEDGCKYCGTSFRITDLFPRVVNLFFLKNESTATASGILGRTTLFCMLAVFVLELSAVIISKAGFLPAKLAACFFAAFFAFFADFLFLRFSNTPP